MADSMEFDLQLSTTKAERQLKSFIAKAEKDMKKLQPKPVEPDSDRTFRARARMLARIAKDEERERQRAAREQKRIDDDQRRMAERAGRDRWKQNQKAAEQERRTAESIAAFRIRQTARIDNAEVASVQVRQRLAQQLADDLTRIEANRSGKTRAIIAAEMSAVATANSRRLQQAAAGAGGMGAAGFGKWNMRAFMVQQAIEDASFAGWKGAANNVSAMAAGLGGPGGLVVMAGLAAASLATLYQTVDSGDRSIEDATDRFERLADAERNLLKTRDEVYRDVAGKNPWDVGRSISETKRAIEANNREISDGLETREREWQTITRIKQAAQDYERFKAARQAVASRETKLGGAPAALKAERDAAEARYEQSMRELTAATGITERDKFPKALEQAADSFNAAGENIDGLRMKQGGLQGLLKEAKELERLPAALERLKDIDFDIAGFGSASGSQRLRDLATEYESQMTGTYKRTLEAREAGDADVLAKLQAKYSDTLKAGNIEGAQKALADVERVMQSQVDDAEMLAEHTSQLVDAEQRRLTAIAEVEDMQESVRDALQDQIRATEKLVQKDAERIQGLEDARTAGREGFESSKFGAELSFVDKEAKEAASKIEKHAESMRDRIKSMMGADQNNPFLNPMQKAASKAYGEAWLRKIDRDEKKQKEQIKQQQQKLERGMLDSREDQLRKRAGVEGGRASSAEKAGEFARAEALREKQRQTLEQLQQLQMSQAGDRPLNEGRAALQRAEDTQGLIDSTFDKELEAAHQQKAQDQQHLQQMKTEMGGLDALKAQIESRQIISEMDVSQADVMLQKLQTMLELKNRIEAAQGAAASPIGAAGVPARATGGPVTGGVPTLVGEAGAELYVPGSTGRIYNTSDTQGFLSMVSSLIEAGDHGGRRATSIVNNTPINNAQFHFTGGASIQDLLRQSAMQAKQAAIRAS